MDRMLYLVCICRCLYVCIMFMHISYALQHADWVDVYVLCGPCFPFHKRHDKMTNNKRHLQMFVSSYAHLFEFIYPWLASVKKCSCSQQIFVFLPFSFIRISQSIQSLRPCCVCVCVFPFTWPVCCFQSLNQILLCIVVHPFARNATVPLTYISKRIIQTKRK